MRKLVGFSEPRRGWGIAGVGFCLVLVSTGTAGAKSKGGTALRAKHPRSAFRLLDRSPNNRHRVELTRRCQLRLDGRLVARKLLSCDKKRVKVLWRRDSMAVAVLQRGPRHAELLVFPQLAQGRPIVWRVPSLVGSSPHLMWISPQSVGVGRRALVPKVVFSWTTQLAFR